MKSAKAVRGLDPIVSSFPYREVHDDMYHDNGVYLASAEESSDAEQAPGTCETQKCDPKSCK